VLVRKMRVTSAHPHLLGPTLTCARIDTPSTAERIATLFAGRPALIDGFNTFPPPGYHIAATPQASSTLLSVSTPEGSATRTVPL
jgi:paired amphipathic helix protein Sin3a